MAQMQMQAQIQVPLQASQQIKAQMMMSQIDSMFKTFEAAVEYNNSGNATRSIKVTINDAAVSQLDLFGAQCDRHKKNEKERDILRAVYAYFWQKKEKSLSSMKEQDVAVINNWLLYIEAALTSNQKSKELQLSQETVQSAEKNMLNRVNSVIGAVLGKNHDARKIGKDVEENAARYKQRNDLWRKQSKAAYNEARQTSRCPTQNDMYSYTGAKVKFASPAKQHVHHIDWMDEDDNEVEAEQENKQEEHQNEQQEAAPGCGGHNHARGQSQPQYHAVLAKKGRINFTRGTASSFSLVAVSCPVPCKVMGVLDSERVQIQLAAPYNDISVPCYVNELQVDAKKVAEFESAYLRANNLKDLGYQ